MSEKDIQIHDGGSWPAGTSWAYRFWRRVLVGEDDECWPWLGKIRRGYGQVKTRHHSPDDPHESYIQAHRMAYYLVLGDIPDGLVLDHTCRTKSCCNPWHLEVVAQGVNNERARFYRTTDALIKEYQEESAIG